MPVKRKYIYFFGNGKAEGSAAMREQLGGKGAGLHEMTRIGVPVPPGFTITTEVCTYYYDHGKTYPPELKKEAEDALRRTEEAMGAKFGDSKNPLLVSCRSGARSQARTDSDPGARKPSRRTWSPGPGWTCRRPASTSGHR